MWLDVVSVRAIAIFIGASDGSRLTPSAAGTVDVSSGKAGIIRGKLDTDRGELRGKRSGCHFGSRCTPRDRGNKLLPSLPVSGSLRCYVLDVGGPETLGQSTCCREWPCLARANHE